MTLRSHLHTPSPAHDPLPNQNTPNMTRHSQSSVGEVLTQNAKAPVFLNQVKVDGGEELSADFFNKTLSPLLESSDLSVKSLVEKSSAVLKGLQNCGVFQSVELQIDRDSSSDVHVVEGVDGHLKPIPVEAHLQLIPNKLENLLVNSVHFKDGHQLYANYSHLNFQGNAESLSVSAFLDKRLSMPLTSHFDLLYKVPLLNPSERFFLDFSHSNSAERSYSSLVNGGCIGLEKTTTCPCTGSSILWKGGLSILKRSVLDVKDGASDVIKTDAGDSIKESVFVSVLSDSRSYLTPQSLFPVSGSLTEASGEFFGLSEGNFIPKATYTNSLWKSVLNKSVTFNLNSSFGAIFNEKKIHFADKFLLGELPGFKTNGVGIKGGSDFFGGSAYYKLNSTLLLKVPKTNPLNPFRLKLSANAGDVLSDLSSLVQSARGRNFSTASSVAAGLVYQNGQDCALSLNYNIPITNRPFDVKSAGLEFSASISGQF